MRKLFLTLALTGLATAAPAATAPKLPITSFEQLQQPLPLPYDEKADAKAAVAAAQRQARASHKLLLIDFGGNWCLDCRILAGTIEVQPLKRFVEQHYVLVTVNIGRFDANMDIPERFGITDKLHGGVPALLVVDPRTSRVLDKGKVSALEDARHMGPQALTNWLAQWVK